MDTADELMEQGIKLFQDGLLDEALVAFQKAKEKYEEEGDMAMVGEMQNNLGVVYRTLGRNDQAIEAFNAAGEIFEEMEDANRSAQVLGNLGGLYANSGQIDEAMQCYREAIDTFRDLGDEERYSQTLMALGELQFRSGLRVEGMTTYEMGVQGIENPSMTQRVIKGLIGLRRRLTGDPAPTLSQVVEGSAESPGEEEEAPPDES